MIVRPAHKHRTRTERFPVIKPAPSRMRGRFVTVRPTNAVGRKLEFHAAVR